MPCPRPLQNLTSLTACPLNKTTWRLINTSAQDSRAPADCYLQSWWDTWNTPESWRVKGNPVEPALLTFLDQWRPCTISRPDNTPTHACALPRIHSAILLLDQRNRLLLHQRPPQPQECMLLPQSQAQQISRRRFAILSPSINKTMALAIK